MDQYSQKDFIKLLKKNSQSIRHDILSEGTDCMRVYDRNQTDFPITVDLYANYVRIVDYSDDMLDKQTRDFCINSCARMLYVPEENVVYTFRAKRQGKEQHEKTENSLRTTVHESGLEFEVELRTYADTGLFLDHYRTRQMIKEMCTGLDVLNLFSYTGSFSVYAAAGQAKSVTSVDLSSTYTKWAEENLKRNGFSSSICKCICQDADKFISERLADNTKYDIIIFDPPSFSNSHKMEKNFDVGKDAIQWIKRLVCLLRKDGIILFSTNLGSFRMDKRMLKGLSVQEITDRVMAPGFSKHRAGAVRSWIMTADDNSLNLDWSEDVKPERRNNPRKDGYSKRVYPKKEYGRNEYKPQYKSGRRPDDRPYHDDNRNEYGRRREDKPSYSKSYSDRPKRDYSSDSHERPQRRYNPDERSSRPRKRFDSEERPVRHYNNDRQDRSHDRKVSKPYGFDSFKPARSRQEDDPDLFWN